jgi:hypothetical protein
MSSLSNRLDNRFWCPYATYMPSPNIRLATTDYDVVEPGQVPPTQRNNGASIAMPPAPRHGGLYSGPPSSNPWNSIPVVPTMTNYIQNNLRSAGPPPGATQQYVGTPRLGNNYVPMPGVYWYNPPEMQGKYAIKAVKESDSIVHNGLYH